MDIVLANPGEGIEGGTVTAVFVKAGDAVKSGQALVEVSTDKASMEVTAEADGTVEAVHVKPGDKVAVGGKLVRVSGGAKPSEAPAPKSPPQPKAEAPAAPAPQPKAEAPRADAASIDVVLANPGEGIEGGTVTAVFVKAGDAVKSGQALVEVSTDKASMEVTAEADGTVEAVHVKPGDKVAVGGKLVTLKTAGAAPTEPKASTPAPAQQAAPTSAAPSPQAQPASNNGSASGTKTVVPAGPATRKLARELGVALGELKGSGREGRVTLDDLKGFVRTERQRVKGTGGGPAAPASGIIVNAFALPPLPDFAKFGPVEVTDIGVTRQAIAKNLTVGWRTMPMVTQHELADITDLEAGRKRIVDALPKGSPKITMTVLAIKACIAALKEFPRFNSSYDMNAGKLVLKKYFHIGIAVDTDAGLKVPVIRDADKKSIRDLAAEVSVIAEKARTNKLTIDEMRGGTFTITNLGGIGGTGFTPLVNYPEVAILGLSKSALQPVVRDGQIVARLVMPLSLTYDHRVIDGADGCRFAVRLSQLFSDPLRLLMET
ncbi:2-oxo acid dehydrogenase subunit E2 [Gemmata sp. G18]|uniref:Dihydrolipoamide acetyltransferase component of pyruvate dehydrogenase complex n=1 Tax=Gemmata palustris TaxID=2822762 RepID=A0ABS5BRF9_9BACT|nr:2-oxo acid dehydrogenase subunit E2 [Gemmata palustris]MBP3956250.1 2-oxo acid dehydrogenase subunit E2 [Gemmata palustris]